MIQSGLTKDDTTSVSDVERQCKIMGFCREGGGGVVDWQAHFVQPCARVPLGCVCADTSATRCRRVGQEGPPGEWVSAFTAAVSAAVRK